MLKFEALRTDKKQSEVIKNLQSKLGCPHQRVFNQEICLDCGKDMWG